MDLLTILAIALADAMDCFAVAVASGIAIKQSKVRHALRMALFFGVFQAVMPVLGWAGGRSVAELIAPWDHWAVFGVLAFLGGKMIYESFRMDAAERPTGPPSITVLLVLSVATSIDALAVGFSFALLGVAIILPAIIIGAVAFVLSLVGVAVGDRLGHFFEKRIEAVGGVVLIAIGVKILLQRLL